MKARAGLARIAAGACMFFVLASSLSGCDQVQLRLRLNKAGKYYCKSFVETNIGQILDGQVQETEQTMGYGYDFDVEDVNTNGDMLMKWTYKRVSLTNKTGGKVTMDYDSSKKDSSATRRRTPMAALDAIIGESFFVKLTRSGKVKEVKGWEKIYSNVLARLPKESIGATDEQIVTGLKQQFGEDVVKEFIETTLAIYPNGAVRAGDSWGRKFDISQGFPMVVQNKWVLKERKAGKSTIEVSGKIEPNPKAKATELGVLKIEYKVSGKQSGEIELAESTGLIVRSTIRQTMAGEMKMGSLTTAGQMDIAMDIDTVTTTEMSERKKESAEK